VEQSLLIIENVGRKTVYVQNQSILATVPNICGTQLSKERAMPRI